MWQELSEEVAAMFAEFDSTDEFESAWLAVQYRAHCRAKAEARRDRHAEYVRLKQSEEWISRKRKRAADYYVSHKDRILARLRADREARAKKRLGDYVQLRLPGF